MKIFRREQSSLFSEILDWMLTPILLLWPISLLLTWLVAQGLADKPFDRALESNAVALSRLITVEDQKLRFQPNPNGSPLPAGVASDTAYYQVLGPHGELLSGDRDFPPPHIPPSPGENTGTAQFRDDAMRGVAIRVAYMWVYPNDPNSPAALVQVGETLGKRSVLATELDTAPAIWSLMVANASIKKFTVDPVPTPTKAPRSTYGKAACATRALSWSCDGAPGAVFIGENGSGCKFVSLRIINATCAVRRAAPFFVPYGSGSGARPDLAPD